MFYNKLSNFESLYVIKIIIIKGNPINHTLNIPLIYLFSAILATHKQSYVHNSKPDSIAINYMNIINF